MVPAYCDNHGGRLAADGRRRDATAAATAWEIAPLLRCGAAQAPGTNQATKVLQTELQKSAQPGIERNRCDDAECRVTTPRNDGDISDATATHIACCCYGHAEGPPFLPAPCRKPTYIAAPRHAGYARTLPLMLTSGEPLLTVRPGKDKRRLVFWPPCLSWHHTQAALSAPSNGTEVPLN